MLTGFVLLRGIARYGDAHWHAGVDTLHSVMAFLNVTKYPPSADFLLLTLGIGALLLAMFERVDRSAAWLAIFGSAPLFFYLIHLYVLHAVNKAAGVAIGADALVSVPSVAWLWAIAATVAVPAWFACRWFARLKQTSDQPWLRYL